MFTGDPGPRPHDKHTHYHHSWKTVDAQHAENTSHLGAMCSFYWRLSLLKKTDQKHELKWTEVVKLNWSDLRRKREPWALSLQDTGVGLSLGVLDLTESRPLLTELGWNPAQPGTNEQEEEAGLLEERESLKSQGFIVCSDLELYICGCKNYALSFIVLNIRLSAFRLLCSVDDTT